MAAFVRLWSQQAVVGHCKLDINERKTAPPPVLYRVREASRPTGPDPRGIQQQNRTDGKQLPRLRAQETASTYRPRRAPLFLEGNDRHHLALHFKSNGITEGFDNKWRTSADKLMAFLILKTTT
jgi:hypothetical protein